MRSPETPRELAYDEFLARKPLKNGPISTGQAFNSEFTKVVKSPKFDVIKTDFADAIRFFDFMTKKKLLLVYGRHLKRTSTFREKNEEGLFSNQRMVELIKTHFGFTGVDDAVSTFPFELKKFKVSAVDLPCLLVFRMAEAGEAELVDKICLKQVGAFSEEHEVVKDLEEIVEKLGGKERERKGGRMAPKEPSREEVEPPRLKQGPGAGPIATRKERQNELRRRLEESGGKPRLLNERELRPTRPMAFQEPDKAQSEPINTNGMEIEEPNIGERAKPQLSIGGRFDRFMNRRAQPNQQVQIPPPLTQPPHHIPLPQRVQHNPTMHHDRL